MKGYGIKFRKSIGGFNKEDVINYIADENRARRDEKKSFKEALDEKDVRIKISEVQKQYYEKKISDLENRCAELEKSKNDTDFLLKETKVSLAAARAEYEMQSAELLEKKKQLEDVTLELEAAKKELEKAVEEKKQAPAPEVKPETQKKPEAAKKPEAKVNLSFKAGGFGFFRRGKGSK